MSSDSDLDFDEQTHRKLLNTLSKIKHGQKVSKDDEKLANKEGDSVTLDGLVDSIRSKKVNQLKNQLIVAGKRQKLISAPAHKQQMLRIQRSVAYEETKKNLDKWNDVVIQNRLAEQLVFPLNREQFQLKTVAESADCFTPRTPLEVEMASILEGSKHNLTNKDPYTEAEKEIIKAMSLQEAKSKCAKMQKMRALMSYREAKFVRQKKIKSKKYHRILKRQKRNKLVKEFEEFITRDPEAAKETLEQLDYDRILERANLKHRSGKSWSKRLAMYAGNDEKVREMVQEQLRLGRQLREKHSFPVEHSNGDMEENEKTAYQNAIEQNLARIEKPSTPKQLNADSVEIMADPDRFLTANTIDYPEETDTDNCQLLAQAFRDDDLIADFHQEKCAIEMADKPTDIDLSLPGWGQWTGPAVGPGKKTGKNRFVIKAQQQPRRDRKLPGVIISEKADDPIRKLQMSTVPFPYTSVDDYETVIRHPIGKDWNPESVHNAMIQPNIVCKLGAIIAPMDKEETLKKKVINDQSVDSDYDSQ